MRNTIKIAVICFFYCTYMQVSAQDKLLTESDLKVIEQRHIKTPVKQLTQPDGSIWLQRDFSNLLVSISNAPEPALTDKDHGHNHNNEQLLEWLNRPHPSVATMRQYFTEASHEFNVPAALLMTYGQQQSNWAQVSESAYGSWGIMGLIEASYNHQIALAAELLSVSPTEIKSHAKSNIRAAAALLSFYQKKYRKPVAITDWYEAIAELTGYADKAMGYAFADRVYKTIKTGSRTISNWGEIIYLPPVSAIKIPEKPIGEELTTLGNGTPDYPGALYNLTPCNFNSRPSGNNPDYYFVHYIAVGTYEGTISWFKNCGSQVSAHYVVRNSDGQITQMVDEANRAWSQGVTEYNDRGIGVEHEVLATNLAMWDSEPMLQAAGSLCANVCNRNTIPKQRRVNNGEKGIYGHSDVRATQCPNMTDANWTNFLGRVNGSVPAVGTPTLYTVSGIAGSSAVTASWRANQEPNLLGYRLYYATGDDLQNWTLAANETLLTPATTSISLQSSDFVTPPAGPVHHFRLHAVVPHDGNPPFESAPSDVYSRHFYASGPSVLIVDGFDRTSGSYTLGTHSFATIFARDLRDRGALRISTTANEMIEQGSVTLSSYDIVVWFVGDESSANVVLSTAEKNAIAAYLQQGGKLFISGSEIAYNLGRSGAGAYDLSFTNNFLKANYNGDGAGGYSPASGIGSTPFSGLVVPFGITYPEDYPDDITAFGGAQNIMSYAVAGKNAGICFSGMFSGGSAPGSLVYLGFPLETANTEGVSAFTEKLLAYFGIAPLSAPPIAVADAARVAQNGRKHINVVANDLKNGGTLQPNSIEITTQPLHGKAGTNANGTIFYEPGQGYTGADAMQYRVANTEAQWSAPATVSLQVVSSGSCDEDAPEVNDQHPLRDLRGAWVSTVSNIDWPSSRTLSTAQQQAELLRIMDSLKNFGINTLFLQVRPECDALYNSPYEPWSYWLTNSQGTAPSPAWDPLAFAVEQAHLRGMDLHAWLNPYRAKQSTPSLASNHVAVQHPDWTFTSGSLTMLNPGLPQVRQYLTTIVADIATRYKVDGIHFDDYFYPYGGMAGQDNNTFTNHNPTNIATIEDWRRNNINTLIGMVFDTIQVINGATGRNIAFGVSPFGIWKSGTPAGIVGTSSFSQIYCDPIAWLQAGKVDYLSPQLYWKITGGQDYDKLSQWWNDQGQLYGKHIYPGLALYKMTDANNWEATEILNQIALNRADSRLQTRGQVMFSTKQLMQNSKGIQGALKQSAYQFRSEAPPLPGKDAVCPEPVTALQQEGHLLKWSAPTAAPDGDTARRYLVFRYALGDNPTAAGYDGSKLWDITPFTQSMVAPGGPWRYGVASIDKNHNLSVLATTAVPSIQLCPNGSTTLPAGIMGSSFQWQRELNGDWQPLLASANFSGVSSPTLNINNLPVNKYGLRLRCVADGSNAGPEYTITFATWWTGSQSNAWDNAANWSCGAVPTAETDIIIPLQVPQFPVVNVPVAHARNITIHPQATLTVAAGNVLMQHN